MLRRIAAAITTITATAVPFTAAAPAQAGDPPLGPGTAGPPYDYPTELVGQYGVPEPLNDQAVISRTRHGYRYEAGRQRSHLVVTRTESGALRFRDTGTARLRRIPAGCWRQRVDPGVSAVCRVPSDISSRRPLLVEVWPRLGSDHVDTSALPATFATAVLGDRGNDTALLGAGPDFFNGFLGRDRVRGGGGNDWLRSGKDADRAFGGAGADQVVDSGGWDLIVGGEGTDHVWAGPGNDRVVASDGARDRVSCSSGRDRVWADRVDRVRGCDLVYR